MKTKTIIMLLLLLPCLINADRASSNGAVNDHKSKPYMVKLGGSSSSSGGSSRSSGGSYSSSGGSSRSSGGSYSSSGGSSRSGGGGGSYRSGGGGAYRAGGSGSGSGGGYRYPMYNPTSGYYTPDDDDAGHAAALPALAYTSILGLLLLCLA